MCSSYFESCFPNKEKAKVKWFSLHKLFIRAEQVPNRKLGFTKIRRSIRSDIIALLYKKCSSYFESRFPNKEKVKLKEFSLHKLFIRAELVPKRKLRSALRSGCYDIIKSRRREFSFFKRLACNYFVPAKTVTLTQF